jgi:Tfp pilus assembly protein PilF
MKFIQKLFRKKSVFNKSDFSNEIIQQLNEIDDIGSTRNHFYNQTSYYISTEDMESANQNNDKAIHWAAIYREHIKALYEYFEKIGDPLNSKKYSKEALNKSPCRATPAQYF